MAAMNELPAAPAACPVCGSGAFDTIDLAVRYSEGTSIHVCGSCELHYLWPLPDDDALAAFYATKYRDLYGDPTPAERHKTDLLEAQQRLSRVAPLVGPEDRLLEIGSGSFAFLKTVSKLVGSAIGIEPDEKTRAWFAGVSDLRTMPTLDSIPVDEGPFDVIALFHVLEHLPDPVRYLARLRDMLAPGGRLLVEVPNADDALITVYGIEAFRRFYYSIAHLTYFNPPSLMHCARAAGLAGTVAGVQRYDLSNHLYWAQHGRPGGQAAYAGTIGAETNEAYARDLIRTGTADTLWGVFHAARQEG